MQSLQRVDDLLSLLVGLLGGRAFLSELCLMLVSGRLDKLVLPE